LWGIRYLNSGYEYFGKIVEHPRKNIGGKNDLETTLPLKRYTFLQLANEIHIILSVASFSLTHKTSHLGYCLTYTFTFHHLLANFLTRISNKKMK
jgi:hypothetical protein